MNLNPHFRDILHALSDAGAEFVVVGAYAISFHGIPRATGDIDVFVRPSPENARKVWDGLVRFGAPLSNLSEQELSRPDLIFRMGREPNGIDLMTEIDGVDFETAWQNRLTIDIDGRAIPFLGLQEILANKRAAGRPKDLADVAWIEWRRKNDEKE
jgi:predicted nucleotidyltransferase